ncbi:uncharacterized oxidoreductase YusZ, partial [Arthrobacter sp. Hiyo6]
TEVAYATDRYGRLDAVVNNAGSATLGTLETLSMDDFRSAMEVNYFGVVALTRTALPHLRSSGGRLVTISSVGGAVVSPSTRHTAPPSSQSRVSWKVCSRWRKPWGWACISLSLGRSQASLWPTQALTRRR